MMITLSRFQFTIVLVLAVAGLLSSCAPLYVPNTVNTPIFTEKGEFQASAFAGTSGFDVQVAYAATDHLGFMVNGNFEDYESEPYDEYRKSSFVEFGVGYFEKTESNSILEIYGGAGFGSIQGLYDDYSFWSNDDIAINASTFRVFVQPALGMWWDQIEGSVAPRLVFVKIMENSVAQSAVFLEPTATIRAGFQKVKVVMQAGLSFPLNEDRVNFDYAPLMISVGIHAKLNRKKDPKNP